MAKKEFPFPPKGGKAKVCKTCKKPYDSKGKCACKK